MKYRKRTTPITAIQYTGTNTVEIQRFVNPDEEPNQRLLSIDNIDGKAVLKNDYIIREQSGKCYPMREDEFHYLYEEIKPGRITYEFDFNNTDDVLMFNRLGKSGDIASVLFEIVHNLEKKCRWEADSLEADSDKYDGIYLVFRKIGELLEENGIDVNDLIK